jgi:hypothetical protein
MGDELYQKMLVGHSVPQNYGTQKAIGALYIAHKSIDTMGLYDRMQRNVAIAYNISHK